MSDTGTSAQAKGSSKSKNPEKSASPTEIKLLEDCKLAMELPLPDKNEYWVLIADKKGQKSKRRLLSFLKSKELTEEDLSQAREMVDRAPGRAKVHIQELLKDNTGNADLMMLFAICSYRMVLNTSNRKGALEGFKVAVKESAKSLLSDGISLYNCEKFLEIYFEYLNRLKRFQVATYRALGDTARQREMQEELEVSIKMVDCLFDEKKRVSKVLNQIKGRFKSSSYTLPWEFNDIKLAGKKVEQNDYRTMCGPAESKQLLVYIMAMLDIFARIPILTPLVDSLLELVPEGSSELYLRKAAVQSRRAFTQLDLVVKEGNMDRLRALGKKIFETSAGNLGQIENQHVKQGFEADPYLNVGRIAILTFGQFQADEQKEMLITALKAIKKLEKLDMSKNRAYSQLAAKMEFKISSLMVESGNPMPK